MRAPNRKDPHPKPATTSCVAISSTRLAAIEAMLPDGLHHPYQSWQFRTIVELLRYCKWIQERERRAFASNRPQTPPASKKA